MANGGGGEGNGDFYAVLGLSKECSDAELRNAYKKLAMRWHPDRCFASGNSKFVEEAKEKFQAIQEAYSVLSDSNRRFLYDVGVYDSDDDENGMGDFLGEMAQMMSQTKQGENGHESFEELQQLFVDMFQSDVGHDRSASSSSQPFCNGNNNKRDNSAMGSVQAGGGEFESGSGSFCFGTSDSRQASKGRGGGGSSNGSKSSKRRNGRKQNVSSRDAEISAA
ncbi:uncharacterized protein A4U43_C06F3640 [Asparagus officinalis]|uniref:J domain-containing protein n=1 Tax=Asparagus officinalis TaxID=4686 RepID=A0A5P1EMM0_ASPOF|nr:uncharacterized protein LOC109845174 [Asparagus officinalis]ONK66049.1 uncharacterized protein A4U43_C06F3640 [Asparagus officinalis]